MAMILSGKECSAAMHEELKIKVDELKNEHNCTPRLAVILVGDDPGSVSYVRGKEKDCLRVGIEFQLHKFDTDYSETNLLTLIAKLNDDHAIHGFIVQLPLPDHINEEKVLYAIDPEKDVDGFHPVNIGRMMIGARCFLPATPHGIQQLLVRNNIPIEGQHVVIVGRSNIVGKPLAMMLVQKKQHANATVTLCHTKTRNLAAITRTADILVAAAGRPHTITPDMVKKDAVVIDVGVNRIDDPTRKQGYRLIGDVDYDTVCEIASAITPVPGGVGPMTRTMLLHNTLQAARNHAGIA
jgi:methylenetetrahydrofolate dehydrogenase (NADP+)/methenyltetrahydrofolate cyclohydrolase